MDKKTIAEKMADYGQGLKFEQLPGPVVHEVKRRVIDSLACVLGAYESLPAKIARASAPSIQNGLISSVIGGGETTPEHAAFANGVMIRYLDYNDTYLSKEPAHPSDNIAAALASAEAFGKSGEEFITAVAAAYEVQCRLCDGASLRARGWDHVTYGAFSSALAASMLMGLTRDQTVNALGIAGTGAPALRQTRAGELSMWKGCAFARAAKDAVFAALLARNGMTGPAPVFEGEFGFFKLVSGPFAIAPFAAGDGQFKILDTYIKYYPAEYHAQSAIGAALDLYTEIGDTDEIESVTINTFRAAYEIIGRGDEKWRPKTRETADHSLPFCVAAALMDGSITAFTFSERLSDERISGLLDRTKVVVDDDLDKLYPEAMPNRVEVVLRSGRYLVKEVIYPKGHPKNPLSDRELEKKFKSLSEWYFMNKESGRVLDALWNLDSIKDIRELMKLLGRGD
ncbi:MAG: MmgE/PrpD family protein [Deltaproteobacteria bacterium]|nr:MmgE/PrpD family protein [Deltaproteobacteria bacterium]